MRHLVPPQDSCSAATFRHALRWAWSMWVDQFAYQATESKSGMLIEHPPRAAAGREAPSVLPMTARGAMAVQW